MSDPETPINFEGLMSRLQAGQVEPAAEIRAAAKVCRQFYVAFTDEGFTDNQALRLTLEVIRAGQAGGS